LEGSLEDLRRQVDQVDSEILEAINRRARLVQEIGRTKAERGAPVYQPAREAEVVGRAIAANAGPLSDSGVAEIFSRIMVEGRSLEKSLRVAFLGPEHTFSHQAAKQVFGGGAEYLATSSIDEIFVKTEGAVADFGVVPVENTTAGTVGDTLDRFVETTSRIVGEVTLPIAHSLLSRQNPQAIRVVYSHPQALSQCQKWLNQNLHWAERVEVASTAAAAARAATEEGSAAVGPAAGAEANGLRVVHSNIQDFSGNSTRFFVIGRTPNEETGRDKSAMIFAVLDRVGALHDVLGILRHHAINLCNIQTRPAKGRVALESGDYLFFAEFWGHHLQPEVAAAVEEIRSLCTLVKMLGSWPARATSD